MTERHLSSCDSVLRSIQSGGRLISTTNISRFKLFKDELLSLRSMSCWSPGAFVASHQISHHSIRTRRLIISPRNRLATTQRALHDRPRSKRQHRFVQEQRVVAIAGTRLDILSVGSRMLLRLRHRVHLCHCEAVAGPANICKVL